VELTALREWFSQESAKHALSGTCPADKKYSSVLEIQKKKTAVLNDIFVLLSAVLVKREH